MLTRREFAVGAAARRAVVIDAMGEIRKVDTDATVRDLIGSGVALSGRDRMMREANP